MYIKTKDTKAEQKIFLGPIFIVGMPRSGTSLLRALLNQYPQVSLALDESHFIPYLVRIFGDPPPFNTHANAELFVKRFHQTPFYQRMSGHGYTFSAEDLYQHATLDSWASILECILRHFSSKPDRTDTIWGDKTPGYIRHMLLLKRLCLEAKFIHIIRDPRDCCLSARKSWGKSIYRAAHRWQSTLSEARQIGQTLNEAYLEVTYEALLVDTESVMKCIADFLEFEYHPNMTHSKLIPKQAQSRAGADGIIKDNMNKYSQYWSKKEIQRVEEIVCNCARELGYSIGTDVTYRPLGSLDLLAYKLYDAVPSLYHHIFGTKSVSKGVKRFLNHYLKSSWR